MRAWLMIVSVLVTLLHAGLGARAAGGSCELGQCGSEPGQGLSVRAVLLQDARHLLVALGSKMSRRVLTPTLSGEVPIDRWKVSPTDDVLWLELGRPLTTKAQLTLVSAPGGWGQAEERVVVEVGPGWPVARLGLEYLWETNKVRNYIFREAVWQFTPCTVAAAGAAGFDPDGRMGLDGGRFTAARVGGISIDAFRRRGELTLLATVTPEQASLAKAAPIIALGANFALVQYQDRLVARLTTTGGHFRLDCGPAPVNVPVTLAVTVGHGEICAYRAGKRIAATQIGLGTLARWPAGALVFGPSPGDAVWQGTVDHVALYARLLTPDELADNAALVGGTPAPVPVKVTPPVPAARPRALVRAKLLAFTATPTPEQVLPYRHALITHDYAVLAVTEGALDDVKVGAQVRVARWGVLGGKQTALAALKAGDEVVLSLERFADHPELERQFTVDELPENFDLPYLLDVAK
jgi:hypothetical protein